LTQTMSQERRKRDVEKQLIDELKQQNVVLEEQSDQVTQESQDLQAKVASKEEIIQAQVSEIQELSFRRKSVTLITASTNTEEEKIEESVPLESGGSAYNDSELLQYINELHEQLKRRVSAWGV